LLLHRVAVLMPTFDEPFPDVRQERCEFCDGGRVNGDPIPTPDGPWYPSLTCSACNGDGWVAVAYEPVDEDDLFP
jgi:hypothetical protein